MDEGSDLDELVRLHHVRLVRLAYVLCGNIAEAEDLVADAYARTWPRLSRGQIDDPLAYLRRSVVNGSSSWRRHRFIVRREELRRRVPLAVGDPADDAGDRLVLVAALRTLPLAQRQVVALRYLEDLSESETATLLGIPAGTVKSRAARALDSLKGQLERDLHE